MSNNNGVTEQNSQVKNGLYNGMPPSSKQGMTPSQLIMTLQWTYGFNQNRASTVKYIGAVKEQRFLLYSSSHTIVMFDNGSKRQKLLQGHANVITSLSVTSDRRWFVSTDKGPESMICVWETICGKPENLTIVGDNEGLLNAYPIKNIFGPHGGYGVVAAEFTPDNRYLITLGNDPEQTVSIWNWTAQSDLPLMSVKTGSSSHVELKINHNDPTEFMTLGSNNVLFYTYSLDQKEIQVHVPIITEKDFNITHSDYTCCSFHPTLGKAMAGNKDGDIIIFENRSLDDFSGTLKKGEKCAVKYLRVNNSAVTFISSTKDQFILVGTEDGAIKVFDLNSRILFWINRLLSGAITSIQSNPYNECLFDDSDVPEMMVSTIQGKAFFVARNPKSNRAPFQSVDEDEYLDDEEKEALANINDESRSGNPDISLIFEGHFGKINAMETIPGSTRFAVASEVGNFQIWDYTTKSVQVSKLFTHKVPIENKHKENQSRKSDIQYTDKPIGINSFAFSRSGKTIGMGFTNGRVKFLEVSTLKELPSSGVNEDGHDVSKVGISKIAFSVEGDYCAVTDENHVIALFKKEIVKIRVESAHSSINSDIQSLESTEKKLRARVEWVFIGRRKTHFKTVTSLLFSVSNGVQVLYSVSKDKHVATYDLTASTKEEGISVKAIRRIEQLYQPESAIIYQKANGPQIDEFIMTFNSGMKCKLFSAETQLCRKTALGPTFTGAINNMAIIALATDLKYFVFSSGNMIGIGKIPIDGNPYKYAGMIGHSSNIANIALAPIGAVLLSSGGTDGIVNMWTMNTSVLDSQVAAGGDGMEPFYKMLDPIDGKNGKIYKEFEDYFFYGQIKTQGEDVSVERIVGDSVSLKEIPPIMQAMGFYPSKQEIDDMVNEVKYEKFADGETIPVTDIKMDDLIKLYLNHKPVFPVAQEEIEISLSHAKRLQPGNPTPLGPVPRLGKTQTVRVEGLVTLLGQYGEAMDLPEIKKRFKELILEREPYFGHLPSKFTTDEFIENILSMSAELNESQ